MALVQELQQGFKSTLIIMGILQAEPHNLTEAQARTVITAAAAAWAELPATPGKSRYLARLERLADKAEETGNLRIAARLLVEIGKAEGFQAPTELHIKQEGKDPDEARLAELLAKLKADGKADA